MAIITCTNVHAGAECGYKPNQGINTPEAEAAHRKAHEVEYEGCVLQTGEHNWYDDSDFYALVWDEKTRSVIEVEYASTRSWTYHNGASVDATPENISRAVAWKGQQIALEMHAKLREHKLSELTEVDEGMEVRSLTTRGKHKGVVGTVKRIMKSNYGPGYVAGVQVDGESALRWIDLNRVERTDAPKGEDLEEALAPTAEEIGEISQAARHSARQAYKAGREHYGLAYTGR